LQNFLPLRVKGGAAALADFGISRAPLNRQLERLRA